MPSFLSRLKAREGLRKKKTDMLDLSKSLPQKPEWDDAYTRPSVDAEEIHELLHFCTAELKARGLDIPFLLLPYRPTSDPSAVRTFVRHFFDAAYGFKGEFLRQELRMTEPMVISGVVKWCWSRLPGGVVGWDAYELFKIGEQDSRMARDSFKTFIPLSVDSGSRQRIIFDFFELISAIAAHGKINGFGGQQLPRLAAWWAFEQKDTGSGFDGGYKAWLRAADATTHLFIAYLRSMSPEEGLPGISVLPRSLEKLLNKTEYPPTTPAKLVSRTNKLVMLVDTVSATPFALLRRAGHFQYRDSDPVLQEFAEYDDPVQALSEECLRVLRAIAAANESQVSSIKHSTSLRDASWSRFEDVGFADTVEEDLRADEGRLPTLQRPLQASRNAFAAGGADLNRPTTPSWADFLCSGFVDDQRNASNLLLPPDKVLPPIEVQLRQQSSQSHRPRLESNPEDLQPGELASITVLDLDVAFWWVWMNSLAPEETSDRKAAFGRCAVIETRIDGGSWLVMEEMIADAAPQQDEGAYIAEKKGFFSWTRRGRSMARRQSVGKGTTDRVGRNDADNFGSSKISVGPDTHAKIQAKAAQIRARKEIEQREGALARRRGRVDESASAKTASVLSLQPHIAGEASSAMKWVKKYDNGATIKDVYLANANAGRGAVVPISPISEHTNGNVAAIGNGAANFEDGRPDVPAKDQSSSSTSREQALDKLEGTGAAPKLSEGDSIDRRDTVDKVNDVQADVGAADSSKQKSPSRSKGKKGLRKLLLRRKNRSSKVPEVTSADPDAPPPRDNAVLEETTPGAVATREPSPADADVDADADAQANGEPTLDDTAAGNLEPTFDPLASDHEPPVDVLHAAGVQTESARPAKEPLREQRAALDPEEEEDDATPPPIARHAEAKDYESKSAGKDPVEKLNRKAAPGVQDRWAQIRKNASQRAATRQRPEPGLSRHRSRAGDDDDTNAEESIESRVARIKAKVAELTGNIENGNTSQQPVVGRS